MNRRTVIAGAIALPIAVFAPVGLAAACGGLVGENGTIQLVRTSTLAAYHDGVERYVTAFEFSGEGKSVGSIVPLPGEPTKVERGGDWTLQRLAQEVAPPLDECANCSLAFAESDGGVDIILEAKIDALDITVVKGGGDEVGEWALEQGFLLSPDAPEVLDYYSKRSPYFMAAKFDAKRADKLGQEVGDSTPIMATIPTDDPWVPLRILALGVEGSKQVEADVFLLTDNEPELLAGGPGVTLERSESASELLLDDLRSDKNMKWVPEQWWLSYLLVDTKARNLDYDLAISDDPDREPSIVDAGVAPAAAVPIGSEGSSWPWWPLMSGATVCAIAFALITLRTRASELR